MNKIAQYIIFLSFPIVFMTGCERGKVLETSNEIEVNTTLDYLEDVEIQYETEAHGKNIIKALNDAITLPEDELIKKRYDDDQGNKEKWDMRTLIHRHFVPNAKKTLEDDFYKEVKSAPVQERIRQILKELEQDN